MLIVRCLRLCLQLQPERFFGGGSGGGIQGAPLNHKRHGLAVLVFAFAVNCATGVADIDVLVVRHVVILAEYEDDDCTVRQHEVHLEGRRCGDAGVGLVRYRGDLGVFQAGAPPIPPLSTVHYIEG